MVGRVRRDFHHGSMTRMTYRKRAFELWCFLSVNDECSQTEVGCVSGFCLESNVKFEIENCHARNDSVNIKILTVFREVRLLLLRNEFSDHRTINPPIKNHESNDEHIER